MKWTFCNTTAETMNISEQPLFENNTLTFHQLAILISAAAALGAWMLSFWLMYMHAAHYTKPAEQRHIIRIVFMVPIYAASNFLQLYYYHHAVYYSVITDCYEAFAIASFFGLMCQYVAPNLHEQKQFFRQLSPIAAWVWPLNWFKAMCGGERGPWRTPKSGLTWFNIVWIGVYHYCFIRVIMTIIAVVTQHFEKYCESSLSPLFAHVWVLAVECVAVAIAMYCIIQYYIQFKQQLAYHKPFLKVLSIKLVIFLSFWQSVAISVASSWLTIIHTTATLQYPDISTGIPALLLAVEMFIFAILHIFAYPWQPYRHGAPIVFYPKPNPDAPEPQENTPEPPLGVLRAFADAFNFWDVVKAFGRGMRWLFVGVKRRHEDISYQKNLNMAMDIDMDGKDDNNSHALYPYQPRIGKTNDDLPIANMYRRSTFGMNHPGGRKPSGNEEGAGLIAHAQGNPSGRAPSPYLEYDQNSDLGYRGAAGLQFHQPPPMSYEPQSMSSSDEEDLGRGRTQQAHFPGHAISSDDYYQSPSPPRGVHVAGYLDDGVGAGQNPHQHPGGNMI